jgi:segregation and condensation protein A
MEYGTHLSYAYTISTPVFEGPLDLLLLLIERAELDITRLALAQVTDQFLEYLERQPETSATDVSSFLVIATKLIQIKSEALLPRPPVREPGEEDVGEALARQLLIYKLFKQGAEWLSARQGRLATYPRLAPAPPVEPALDMRGLTAQDILLAAQFILARQDERTELGMVVAPPKITIREKILHIAEFLKIQPHGAFAQLLPDRVRRIEVVVTFLALLELVKRNMLLAEQESLFGEIFFSPSENWEEDFAFDLEFGE